MNVFFIHSAKPVTPPAAFSRVNDLVNIRMACQTGGCFAMWTGSFQLPKVIVRGLSLYCSVVDNQKKLILD